MNAITLREAGADAHIQFPFALREAFRAVFKTARWEPASKTYVVKNTTANKNKFEAFKSASSDALSALNAADNAAATDDEFDRMRQALSQIQHETALDEAAIEAAKSEYARLRMLLLNAKEQARAIKAELATAAAAVEAELAPVKSLCAALGVDDAIRTLHSYARRRFLYADEKGHFSDACRTLGDANRKLGAVLSVSLPALIELCEANCYRLDQLHLALGRNSNIYRGIRTISAASSGDDESE